MAKGNTGMDNDLVISVFKELAVLKGERSPEGDWSTEKPWHLKETPKQAIELVERAKSEASIG